MAAVVATLASTTLPVVGVRASDSRESLVATNVCPLLVTFPLNAAVVPLMAPLNVLVPSVFNARFSLPDARLPEFNLIALLVVFNCTSLVFYSNSVY